MKNLDFTTLNVKSNKKMDSRSQQLLTKFCVVEKYDISAFHCRVNWPHLLWKTNSMKLWIIIIFSIFSWFWKILIFMEKFKLTQNHHQISQKDGWHEFRKPRRHSFWQKMFGQPLLTFSIHIFVLKFPWDCQKWHFFDISFGFWVNRSQQKSTNVDQIFCCWKVWHLSFLNPCRTLFHHSHNTLYSFVKICLFSKAKYESKFIEKFFSSKFWLYNIRWQSGNFANEYIWVGPL